jgi:hypothetical protein
VNYNGWEKNLYPTLAQRNSGKAYMGTVDPVTGVAKTGRIFAIEDPAKGELADLNKKLITYNKSPVADGIRLLIDAAKQEAAWNNVICFTHELIRSIHPRSFFDESTRPSRLEV